jgi:signal transduction histidine kinase/ligand-binding sensor domain-containing protein
MKKRFHFFRLCLLLSFLSPALSGYGQDMHFGISPSTPLKNCSVDQWTGDNGLLSNNLTSVIQARTGFLWITTNNGLMRFDGSRLEIFDRGVLPFLATDAFYRVYEDSAGTLWFATRGNGIVKYRNNKFEPHLSGHPGVPKSVRALLIMDDGTIYAGSDNKGVVIIRDTVVTRVMDADLDNVSILSLESGPDGAIFIGTNNRGLLKYHNGNVETLPINGRTDHNVNTIRFLPGGKLYVGTSEGLYLLEDGKTLGFDFLENIQVNHLNSDRFGSLWIATERGLARINDKAGIREFLKTGRSFPGAHVTSVFPDREGSLWMSTGKSGLLRIKESPIRNYNENHGLSVDRVNVVTEAPDGKFYVCLDDGFINVVDNETISDYPIQNKFWNESIRDILIEKDGTTWIASYNGVIRKKGPREKLFNTASGLPSNSVRRIFRDSRGTFWFGTRTSGVIKFRDDKVVKVFNKKTGLSSDYILAIEEDHDGKLLIGTHSGGLNIINPDGTTEIHHVKRDDDGVLIFNLDIDRNNNVFLATSVGLYYFDRVKKSFTRIILNDVVKGESYFDWVEDRRGNIWIPTNIGIVQIDKKQVLDYLAGKIPTVQSKIFNDYDGMKNKECTGATRSTLSSSGEVWVPTIEGICVINPENLKENTIVPHVYITEVTTDKGIIANPEGEIVVEPGNFRITINFTSTSLRAPNKVKFSYRLDNVDQNWKDASALRRSVDYTNLSPGKYTFFVKATNNDGVWNAKGATVSIKVKPFYYQTGLFYVIVFSLLVVAFVAIYKWRVSAIEQKNEELQKVNRELDRFVYSASHDLRAPLTSILGLVKLTRLDQDPEARMQYLEMVEKSIHKLDGFIHDIINYSRNARTEVQSVKVDFHTLINGILESLKYQDKADKIHKEVRIEGKGDFYSDVKRLEIVLFNLISNAIKYHNTNQASPLISIRVSHTSDRCLIDVEDNGWGIDKQHQENIFKMFYRADEKSTGSGLGLFIAKEAVEKLKGNLTVQSTPGKGSVFRINIPSIHR